MWARMKAMGSWVMRPTTIRAAWGASLVFVSIAYSTQGVRLAMPRVGEHWLFTSAPFHLTWWGIAAVTAVALAFFVHAPRVDAFLTRHGTGAAAAALVVATALALGAAICPRTPTADAFLASAEAPARSFFAPPGATRIAPVLGADESYVVRTSETSVYRLDDRTLKIWPATRRGWVRLGLDDEPASVWVRLSEVRTLAVHRVGDHWIVVAWRGAHPSPHVLAGPRRWMSLGVAEALPGRVGAGDLTGWCLALSIPCAAFLWVCARRARRTLAVLESATHAEVVAGADDTTATAVLTSGERTRLHPAPPADARTVFLKHARAVAAYREEPRAVATVIHTSPFDRTTTLSLARTRIARLDALCVLVVLVLTAPALGAHLRGLTVSLPAELGATP